jgi:hypothetical protein
MATVIAFLQVKAMLPDSPTALNYNRAELFNIRDCCLQYWEMTSLLYRTAMRQLKRMVW